MYNLKEVMGMFKMGERTLRRYLKEGILEGSKIGGVWRFSEKQIEDFLQVNDQLSKVKRETSRLVNDFINMPNPKKSKTTACVLIDLFIDDYKDKIEQVKKLVYEKCNSNSNISMNFLKDDQNYRFFLSGDLAFISEVSNVISGVELKIN